MAVIAFMGPGVAWSDPILVELKRLNTNVEAFLSRMEIQEARLIDHEARSAKAFEKLDIRLEGLRDLENQSIELTTRLELLVKSVNDLIPVVATLTKSLAVVTNEVGNLIGKVAESSDKLNREVKRFDESITTLDGKFEGFRNQIAIGLLAVFLTGLAAWWKAMSKLNGLSSQAERPVGPSKP